MSEKNGWKCVKCGSTEFRKKQLRIPSDKMITYIQLNAEFATAYICKKCGYMELYGDII